MTEAEIMLGGARLRATTAGAVVWSEYKTVIVADLHLEKGSSLARRGSLLPPYDTRLTLTRLAQIVDLERPERVICLGDSFHDPGGPPRLTAEDRRQLEVLTARREWIWITGNHDGGGADYGIGRRCESFRLGRLTFCHKPGETGPVNEGGEVSGHLHPKARILLNGQRVVGRCFVTDGRRLILPAFGAYTGGLDVQNRAFGAVLATPVTIYVIGWRRIHILPGWPSRGGGVAEPATGGRRRGR